MKSNSLTAFAFGFALLGAANSFGQTQAVTDPVGFVSVTVPIASDVALGASLGRANEFQGIIQEIDTNTSTVTVAGTPAWLASQFVYAAGTQPKSYYLRIDSGPKEGLILPIVANGTSSVTVTIPSGDDLSGVSSSALPVSPATTGDSISIAPNWTLSTLVTGAIAGTQVFALPIATAGINLPAITYTFNGTNWLRGAANANDDTIALGQGILVRNNSTTVALSLSVVGAVPMSAHRLRLATLAANTKQDIRFVYTSPIPELIGTAINGSSLSPGDQILYIDNSTTGKNKPTTTLTWNGTNWLQGASVVTNTFTFQPGSSYLFRKNQSANPSSIVWSDLQSYLQ